MPARSILPTTETMFTALFHGSRRDILERPPWGAIATPELAIDYLGVHPQVLWSYRLRREGPEVERDARRLYRKVGRRNLYRFENVLRWLPGGERKPLWSWSARWFQALGEKVADDPDDVLALIANYETNPIVKGRPFGFRKLEHGLARLRVAYGSNPSSLARTRIRCSISPVMLRLSASASPWPQPVGRSNGRRPQAWSDWPFTSPRAVSATFFSKDRPGYFLMIVLLLF